MIYHPGIKEPEIKEIPNDIKAFQAIVRGYIEVITFLKDRNDILLVCNEEGKLLNLPPNRKVNGDTICGDFFIVRAEGAEFVSLTELDIKAVKKFFS